MTEAALRASEPHRFSMRLPPPGCIGVAAFGLAVVAAGLHFGIRMHQQHVAIREITAIGGGIRFADPTPRTRWLHRLVGLVPKKGVSGLTQDDATEVLKRIVAIEEIEFWPDQDTFYARSPGRICGPLPWTEGLTVNDTNLACVEHLPNLKRLCLTWTNISDAGMRHVGGLHALEQLNLDGTDISDAGLRELRRLHRLRALRAVGTRVTQNGVAELRAALPRCTVTYESYGRKVVDPPEKPESR
jgi:hypothetical protein